MSVENFVKHGVRGHLLHEITKHPYGPVSIKVYDIAHECCFGVVYPDNARMASPRAHFPTAQRAYDKLKEEGKLFMPTQDGMPMPTSIPRRRGLKPTLRRRA